MEVEVLVPGIHVDRYEAKKLGSPTNEKGENVTEQMHFAMLPWLLEHLVLTY